MTVAFPTTYPDMSFTVDFVGGVPGEKGNWIPNTRNLPSYLGNLMKLPPNTGGPGNFLCMITTPLFSLGIKWA